MGLIDQLSKNLALSIQTAQIRSALMSIDREALRKIIADSERAAAGRTGDVHPLLQKMNNERVFEQKMILFCAEEIAKAKMSDAEMEECTAAARQYLNSKGVPVP